MVLDYVANRARFIVEFSSILDAEIFSHRDLNTAYVVTIPDRFQDRVCKAGIQDILNWLLTQVVINSEDVLLGKILREHPVQFRCGRAVVTERLFNNQTSICRTA